jgi:mono/diheme cytochrome c family protein
MFKHASFALFAAAVAATLCFAGQSNSKITINAPKTTATNGQQMFASYCAPCHGVDGRGSGPVAAALKNAPADLTVLSRNNNGKFPGTHVLSVLQFGPETPSSHGNALMPVWGPVLGNMSQTDPNQRILRINNISRYLQSIQAR